MEVVQLYRKARLVRGARSEKGGTGHVFWWRGGWGSYLVPSGHHVQIDGGDGEKTVVVPGSRKHGIHGGGESHEEGDKRRERVQRRVHARLRRGCICRVMQWLLELLSQNAERIL